MNKKISEMTISANAAGFSVPLGAKKRVKKNLKEKTVKDAFRPAKFKFAVYTDETEPNPRFDPNKPSGPKNRKFIRKHEKSKMPYTKANETKSETMLRETIRELIFLNKVKFYEEQTKLALQEKKLRYVIKSILQEASDKPMLPTVIDNFARDAIGSILKRFENSLQSMSDRPEARKAYVNTVTNFIDKYLRRFIAQLSGKIPAPQTEEPQQQTGPVVAGAEPAMEEQEGEQTEEPQTPEEQEKQFQALSKDLATSTAQEFKPSDAGTEATDPEQSLGNKIAYGDIPQFGPKIASFILKLSTEEDRLALAEKIKQSIPLNGEQVEDKINATKEQTATAAPPVAASMPAPAAPPSV